MPPHLSLEYCSLFLSVNPRNRAWSVPFSHCEVFYGYGRNRHVSMDTAQQYSDAFGPCVGGKELHVADTTTQFRLIGYIQGIGTKE